MASTYVMQYIPTPEPEPENGTHTPASEPTIGNLTVNKKVKMYYYIRFLSNDR